MSDPEVTRSELFGCAVTGLTIELDLRWTGQALTVDVAIEAPALDPWRFSLAVTLDDRSSTSEEVLDSFVRPERLEPSAGERRDFGSYSAHLVREVSQFDLTLRSSDWQIVSTARARIVQAEPQDAGDVLSVWLGPWRTVLER